MFHSAKLTFVHKGSSRCMPRQNAADSLPSKLACHHHSCEYCRPQPPPAVQGPTCRKTDPWGIGATRAYSFVVHLPACWNRRSGPLEPVASRFMKAPTLPAQALCRAACDRTSGTALERSADTHLSLAQHAAALQLLLRVTSSLNYLRRCPRPLQGSKQPLEGADNKCQASAACLRCGRC